MSTSWDNDGTISRACASLEGANFVPNCFGGTFIYSYATPNAVYPQLAVGLNDFTIEWWMRGTIFNTPSGQDERVFIGFFPGTDFPTDVPLESFIWGKSTFNMGPIRGWHHWMFQCDRSDKAHTYIDGVEVTAIAKWNAYNVLPDAAVDLSTYFFCPLWMDDNAYVSSFDKPITADPGTDYPDVLTDPLTNYGFSHFPCYIGPMAVHIGLLSAANYGDSIRRRSVADLGASTVFKTFWRNVTSQVTGWDVDPRHVVRGISDYAPVPVGAPEIATGTLVVRDESAAGNDLTLETLETYGQAPYVQTGVPAVEVPADGERARCAFLSDPFFETGGGAPGGA